MYIRLFLLEIVSIIILIIVNIYLKYRRKYLQYDLKATILILALSCAFHLINMIGSPIFNMIGKSLSSDIYFYDESLAVTYIVATGIECIMILIIKSYILKTSIRGFFDTERLSHHLSTGLAISTVAFGLIYLVNLLPIRYEYKFGYLDPTNTSHFSIFIIIIMVVIIGPVIEEIIFRGFIFLSVERSIGEKMALIITSLAWALFHPDKNFIAHLVSGMILGVLFLKTRSLIPPIMLHSTRNLFYMLNFLAIF